MLAGQIRSNSLRSSWTRSLPATSNINRILCEANNRPRLLYTQLNKSSLITSNLALTMYKSVSRTAPVWAYSHKTHFQRIQNLQKRATGNSVNRTGQRQLRYMKNVAWILLTVKWDVSTGSGPRIVNTKQKACYDWRTVSPAPDRILVCGLHNAFYHLEGPCLTTARLT
jgi:hypothetical protein